MDILHERIPGDIKKNSASLNADVVAATTYNYKGKREK